MLLCDDFTNAMIKRVNWPILNSNEGLSFFITKTRMLHDRIATIIENPVALVFDTIFNVLASKKYYNKKLNLHLQSGIKFTRNT